MVSLCFAILHSVALFGLQYSYQEPIETDSIFMNPVQSVKISDGMGYLLVIVYNAH